MDEDKIRLEARLTIIEHFLCEVLSGIFAARAEPTAELDQFRTRTKQMLQQLTIPGLDAASSDLYASELEYASDSLLRVLKKHLANKVN